MSKQLLHMQKLAGLITEGEYKEALNENALKTKIKELVYASLGEAKKKKKDKEPSDVAPQEDIDINIEEPTSDTPTSDTPTSDTSTDTMSPEASAEIDIDPKVKAIQDALSKALANAKALGDEKLVNQIGNTITMLVRTQVVGQQAVAESLNEEDIFNGDYNVSDEIYEKMNDLVNQSDYMNFINSAGKIMEDLVDEGFEVKDIFYYLYTRLTAEI